MCIIDDQDEQEVEEVLDYKRTYRKLSYRINQKRADDDLEQYLASNVKYTPHKLRDYYLANNNKPGPPKLLREQVKAQEEEKDDYEDLNNDKEMPTRSRASFFRRGG